MKLRKSLAMVLAVMMLFAVLAGCGAKEVAVKTGLGTIVDVSSSKDAKIAQANITIAAVTVDDEGVIDSCVFDVVQAKINFDATGKITTDKATTFQSKHELGDAYGMKVASGIGKEWFEQAEAFAAYVKGKTLAEVKGIALEGGKATDADLTASVTIGLTDFIAAIEKAVNNAAHLGATKGDELKLGSVTTMDKSKDATSTAAGLAQAYSVFGATTVKDGKITSCALDAVQANVNFDATGKIVTDLTAEIKTKNELGTDYGMQGVSGIGKEWNEQAAAFAEYVSGKTVDEVKGIALEGGKATDADLTASVTIGIAEFIAVIEK